MFRILSSVLAKTWSVKRRNHLWFDLIYTSPYEVNFFLHEFISRVETTIIWWTGCSMFNWGKQNQKSHSATLLSWKKVHLRTIHAFLRFYLQNWKVLWCLALCLTLTLYTVLQYASGARPCETLQQSIRYPTITTLKAPIKDQFIWDRIHQKHLACLT